MTGNDDQYQGHVSRTASKDLVLRLYRRRVLITNGKDSLSKPISMAGNEDLL